MLLSDSVDFYSVFLFSPEKIKFKADNFFVSWYRCLMSFLDWE